MKKSRILGIVSLVLACGLTFGACSEERSIASIQKSGSNGLTDIYTIYYTDGTTDTFEITNGKDGEGITVTELYEKYKEEYGEIAYADFLALYMSFGSDDYTVVNEALSSCAKVYTEFTEKSYIYRPGGLSTTTKKSIYTGSAVVFELGEEYSYLLSNYHVVYNPNGVNKIAEKIHCYLYGSEDSPVAVSSSAYDYGEYAIECEFVGGSVAYDIAVMRAKTSDLLAVNGNVQAVELADGYHVGQTAIAIGNPDDGGLSVTKGVVSVDNDYITLNIDGTTREYRSIRIDTALYSGNSGGGLFNVDGKLIGINNAGNGDEQNINYAIPLPIVRGVAENVMRYHLDGDSSTNGVYKITLGVTVLTEKSRYVYDENKGYGKIVEDIVIDEISNGSIAEKLGLKAGDKLRSMEIDGTVYALNRSFDISDLLLRLTVNTRFSIGYERGGEAFTTDGYTVRASDLAAVA